MSTDTASRPVVSDPAPLDQDGPLWYSDPTGETAVRNLLSAASGDDFEVIDNRGNTIFRIKRNTLLEAVVPQLQFTLTRRGRNTIRAHKKNAPAAGGHQREGETSI